MGASLMARRGPAQLSGMWPSLLPTDCIHLLFTSTRNYSVARSSLRYNSTRRFKVYPIAASREVAGSRPDVVMEFFQFT
jgi:hypothetical protein